jgi:hypothetical protein
MIMNFGEGSAGEIPGKGIRTNRKHRMQKSLFVLDAASPDRDNIITIKYTDPEIDDGAYK